MIGIRGKMWIRREKYEELVKRGENAISQREYNFLLSEVDYWRGKFESEKERADRAVDSILELGNSAPVSEGRRTERSLELRGLKDIWEKRENEVGEIYKDAIEAIGEGEEVELNEVEDEEGNGDEIGNEQIPISPELIQAVAGYTKGKGK